MPRSATQRRIIVADTEEELATQTDRALSSQAALAIPLPTTAGPRRNVPTDPTPDDPVRPQEPAPGTDPSNPDFDEDDLPEEVPEEDDDPNGDLEQDDPDDDLEEDTGQPQPPAEPPMTPAGLAEAVAAKAEILPPPTTTYQSRITIVDAWQYPGNVLKAPPWIDRNWIGWADDDALRGKPSGPCLRVPTTTGDFAVCRVGDYVAQQEVLLDAGLSDLRIDVWAKETFHKMFIPK